MEWKPITPTEPNKNSGLVVLACNGHYLGSFTTRWWDTFEGRPYECWKINGFLYDGDDDPTHYLVVPDPPKMEKTDGTEV